MNKRSVNNGEKIISGCFKSFVSLFLSPLANPPIMACEMICEYCPLASSSLAVCQSLFHPCKYPHLKG